MSMKKKIEIDGQEVAFKASAAIPRIYRMRFHGISTRTYGIWKKGLGTGIRKSPTWICSPLEMFENIAYVMAKHADPSIPDTPEEWLDEL